MFEVEIRQKGGQEPGAALWLPAAPYELLDALDRVGARGLDDTETSVIWSSCDIPNLEPSPDFACLNALAEKIASLTERQHMAFLGLAAMESQGEKGPLPAARALDLAYSTDCCHVVEARNDSQLGRFYAENGFIPGLDGLPDSIFKLLDFEKIGRDMRLAEGGVFVERNCDSPGGYVLRHSDLKQAPPVPTSLPRPDYIFRFTIQAFLDKKNTAVLDLPASQEQLDGVLGQLHAASWDEIHIVGYDGAIPNLLIPGGRLGSIGQLNALAETLEPVAEKGQLRRYKAVLAATRCMDPEQMERIAAHLDEYIFSPSLRTERDIALSELRCMLDDETLELLLPHLDVECFGRALAEEQNAAVTAYGTIERQDGGPIKNSKKGGLIVHKLDSVTKEPLEGVQFKITYADGRVVDAEGGKLSSNGLYWTDSNGQIVLDGITGTLVVTEVQTIPGYTIHEETRSQTVVVNPDDTQELWFYNDPVGGVELVKVDASDTTKRLANATFEIRRMDDGLVDTVTTDSNGRVFLDLEDGSYYAVEIKAPEGYKLDNTPHYFEVKDGKSPTVTVTNQPFSGIIIHKIDSVTGEGVYGVTFLVYDSTMHPIDQVTTDQDGYVYLDSLDFSGKLFLREMEAEGYIADTRLKTVYVKPGEVTEITWENTPITGQLQITKTSEDYNSVNGWPAGTPLPGTVFEIYNRAGNLVDTIETDKFGIARSRALPLGRYTIRETKATQFYGISNNAMEVEIEFAGQIVRVAMTNKSLYTSVSITKRGYSQVMPGQDIRYTFSDIANNSTTALTSFFWRDTLPAAVRLERIITGTYNVRGSYKIVYKTNLNGNYRTMYDNLSTQQNKVLDASAAALGLAGNEYVTEFMVVFGVVPSNFRQVEAPMVDCRVNTGLPNNYRFVNQADVGGVYNGQWIMAVDRWVTSVYAPTKPLPRTGY